MLGDVDGSDVVRPQGANSLRKTHACIADLEPDGFQLLQLGCRVLPLAIGAEAAADGTRVWLSDGRHTEWLDVRPALRRARRADTTAGAALVAPMTGKVVAALAQVQREWSLRNEPKPPGWGAETRSSVVDRHIVAPPKPIRYIINTGPGADHVGGNETLAASRQSLV